jgi:uncharacterized protein
VTNGTDKRISIPVTQDLEVSALAHVPKDAHACYVLAHGAGAGMQHAFLSALAKELGQRGIATLRYNFPYLERGEKRPDRPETAHATVRAAVAEAARLVSLPIIAGGKSFGGRMTSQAQALAPLPQVKGLAFIGFPLHPAGRRSQERARHLFDVKLPMLFLQGTRDALADLTELHPVVATLGERATLQLLEEADHSFHVPKRTGRMDDQVIAELADALTQWIQAVTTRRDD